MNAKALRLFRTAVAVMGLAIGGLAALCAAAPALAQDQSSHIAINPAEISASRDVRLGLGKSLVIDLPRDAKDVLVSSPQVADAVMRTARRAYLIGVEVGETNVFFFDAAGRQIAVLQVHVGRDLSGLAQQIRQLVPGSRVRVESVNDNVVLTGSVNTPSDAVNASNIAARFIGDPERVLNMIETEGSEQVHLKVTVAEMKRDLAKELGIDLDVASMSGNLMTAVMTRNPFAGSAILDGFSGLGNASQQRANIGWSDGRTDITARMRALETAGVLRILSEPTLSAISGESAEFLAGGEFPIIVGTDRNTGAPIIEFKEFGVSLAFTPVVHSGGRITLKVKSEVSEIASENSVSFGGQLIPGINTRRTDTTIELPSGGALVLAGLIQDNVRQAMSGVPGLKNLPVLGALFRSREFIRNETELVVIATPYLVSPTSRQELTRPDKNFAPADDVSATLLGRLNRIYGTAGAAPSGRYHGHVGFIVE
jgi:pilus assembly protein CpaC